MATFMIANRECLFPSISYAALELYKPTCSTYYLAWKAGNTSVNILAATAFDVGYTIGAITRPAQCMSDNVNERLIYLFEQPSQTWLDHVEWFIRVVGLPYVSMCPYNVALRKKLLEVDEQDKRNELLTYLNGCKLRALQQKNK